MPTYDASHLVIELSGNPQNTPDVSVSAVTSADIYDAGDGTSGVDVSTTELEVGITSGSTSTYTVNGVAYNNASEIDTGSIFIDNTEIQGYFVQLNELDDAGTLLSTGYFFFPLDGEDVSFVNEGVSTVTSTAQIDSATPMVYSDLAAAPVTLDGTVSGTAGDDVIDASYTGDPDGDMVDANDNAAGTNDDIIEAGAGNDVVTAGLGDDIVYGDVGDDTIYGGDGDDTIYGGDGVDTLYGDVGNDVLYGGTGGDQIKGGDGDDTIYGGIGGDGMSGEGGDDTFMIEDTWSDDPATFEGIFGGETTETAGDTLDATAVTTDTTLDFTAASLGADEESGHLTDATNDLLFMDVENFELGSGDDTIIGSTGGESVDGGAGDDVFTGGGGGDTLTGGSGDDTFIGIGVGDFIDGSETGEVNGDTLDLTNAAPPGGTITVTFDPNNPENGTVEFFDVDGLSLGTASFINIENIINPNFIVEGTAGDDVIDVSYTGDPGGDMVDANDNEAGNNDDIIEAGAGDDVVTAGLGDDTVYGDVGDDTIYGGDGVDTLYGDVGNDVLYGGTGDDQIKGGDGDDTIYGGIGGDGMSGEGGDDTFMIEDTWSDDPAIFEGIFGGETTETAGDTLDATAVTTDTTLDFTAASLGADEESGHLTDATNDLLFMDVENFELGSGDDTIIGSTGGESVDGGAGDDVFTGGGGGDTLTGGSGDDTFIGIGVGDFIDGSETGEVNGDTLDLTNAAPPGGTITVTYDPNNPENGTVEFFDADGLSLGTASFINIENVTPICFTAGTRIRLRNKEVAVEDLEVGQMVQTMDHGLQKIRWIGKRTVKATGNFAPVVISKGALGNDRDLRVSPQHRMLISGWKSELLFGEDQVLAAAKYLVNGDTIYVQEGGEVKYFHIMFDRHEIVYANGAPSESFHPGETALNSIERDARDELFALFPELETMPEKYGPAARTALRSYEAKLLINTK